MTVLNKQVLRQLATDAHELGIIKRYTIGIEANKRFVVIATPLTVLALLDELEAAERLITEWEQRELSNKRQLVINGLCESGEPFWEIDDYMKKWDTEHPREAAAAGIDVNGGVSGKM